MWLLLWLLCFERHRVYYMRLAGPTPTDARQINSAPVFWVVSYVSLGHHLSYRDINDRESPKTYEAPHERHARESSGPAKKYTAANTLFTYFRKYFLLLEFLKGVSTTRKQTPTLAQKVQFSVGTPLHFKEFLDGKRHLEFSRTQFFIS